MADNKLYKLVFMSQDEVYEIYARQIYQADLFGFITVEGLSFTENKNSKVIDPSEERLQREFKNVNRFFIPLHNVIRIEEVKEVGTAKITELSDKIAKFPSPSYSGGGQSGS